MSQYIKTYRRVDYIGNKNIKNYKKNRLKSFRHYPVITTQAYPRGAQTISGSKS